MLLISMKLCSCGAIIKGSVTIDGKPRNLKNRTKCLECLPLNSPRTRSNDSSRKARRWYHSQKAINGIDPIRQKRDARKLELVKILGGGCQVCGYDRCVRNLSFHHLENKEFGISSRSFQFTKERIASEVRKCVLVCHNCHGEIHDGIISEDSVVSLNLKVKALVTQWLE